MIPCPDCSREFETRAGLGRHRRSAHATEKVDVNLGGLIEPVVPVEPETYAESLTDAERAPGQERFVDAPVDGPEVTIHEYGNVVVTDDGSVREAWLRTEEGAAWHERYAHMSDQELEDRALGSEPIEPTREERIEIRSLIRSGHSRAAAFERIMGFAPPPEPTPPLDERPLFLQQVAHRVREDATDHRDTRRLLKLAEIGQTAIVQLQQVIDSGNADPGMASTIDNWKAALQ